MNKHAKIIALIEGILAVGCFYLSWCFATIFYKSNVFGVFHVIMTILSASSYAACVNKVHKEKMLEEEQFKVLNLSILVISLLVSYDDIIGEYGNIYFIVADIIWIFVACCLLKKFGFSGFCSKREWLQNMRKHLGMVALLLVAVILAMEPFQMQFRWDGALYEQACSLMNIHSLSSLGAYGHLSQAYGSMYYLLWIIIKHTGSAMTIMNILLYLGSIVGFYALTRQVNTGKKKILLVVATAMYAFSPFLLGMVNYYSLDYAALCLFVWMVYFAYTRKWIFHFIAALCFTFTKEPSVVVYGAFCVGVVLVDWIKCHKNGFVSKICYIIQQYQYYLMLLVGMLWIVMYLLIGGWSGGVGAFSLDFQYILDKLKVLYVLNFNWLMVLGIVIGIVIILFERKKIAGLWEICVPVSFSLIMYTIFSAMFKTVNHARYAATIPSILYLLVFWILVSVLRKGAIYIFTLLGVLMLISSYRTVDPVSLLSFQRMNIGSETMITTGAPTIGDSMIYNKQMLRQEYALNQALEYALDKEYRIYMPMFHGLTYSFDGLMVEGVQQDGLTVVTQFWDEEKNVRTAYVNNKTVAFSLYEVSDELEALNNIDMAEKGCYIYSDILGMELAERIIEKNPAIPSKEFCYDGWILYMLEF